MRFIIILITAALIAGCGASDAMSARHDGSEPPAYRVFGYDDSTPRTVDLTELVQGCPRVDCIPAIDEPKFIDVDAVDFIGDDDLVMALEHNGEARAYPIVILDSHEIVNDVIGGEPIAISWCPLCGSGLAFERTIDGQVLEFGVSGFLHNSDLVMYDRGTRSLWGQISGEAIAGPLAGTELQLVQATITEWSRWRDAHPETLVLSTDTGYNMRYAGSVYGDYAQSSRLMFPVANKNFAIHPKTVVYGLRHQDESLAVTLEHLQQQETVSVELAGDPVNVKLHDNGMVTAELADTGESLTTTRLFWFGWLNFNPDTRLVPGP